MNPVVKQHIPLTLALWNIDPEDWRAKKPQEIVDRVNQNARPGRVIDFHDTHAMTADSLELMLPELQAKFHLVTVSQLFDLAPGQRGEFYGR